MQCSHQEREADEAWLLLLVYGYYHYSGAAKAINAARQVSDTAEQLKNKAVSATPSPKAILGFVRSAAHSYAGAFPGAGSLVDSTVRQHHLCGDDLYKLKRVACSLTRSIRSLSRMVQRSSVSSSKAFPLCITSSTSDNPPRQIYSDVSKAASEGGDKVSDNIVNAIQDGISQIQKLSSQLSAGAIAPLLASHPQLKSALNDTLGQMNSFGEKYGPEARKITEDTVNQIKKLTDQGINGETIAKAAALAKQKLQEIKDLGAKAGQEAYSKAAEGARPYLDKAPEVKKYLEESVDGLKEYVGDDGVKLINDTYSELEAAGKKGDSERFFPHYPTQLMSSLS